MPSTRMPRRQLLLTPALSAGLLVPVGSGQAVEAAPQPSRFEPMPALANKDYGKPRMSYADFVQTPSGLQYKDLREGEGPTPSPGQTAVVDWSGYTIGYYGRPFEARNKPKGSSFTGENKDYFRFVVGSNTVIPAFEEAVQSMKPGGVRRIVVPVELSYPAKDWRSLGPRPSTFAGDRALDFVLANQGMIDKTLLFDIELIKIQG
ncbi:hypothetical protein V8C86DRAFT_1212147 [Haematococcus lacustris]